MWTLSSSYNEYIWRKGMESEKKIKVGGIMLNNGLATVRILSVPGKSDILGIVLYTLGKESINIEFVVHNLDIEGHGNLTFCINQKSLGLTLEVLGKIKPFVEAKEVSCQRDVAVISVFGPHFREKPMISGLMFNALGIARIDVLAVSTSISSCCCLIHSQQIEEAMKALHKTFEAPHQITNFAP
jgi:aspartokinase